MSRRVKVHWPHPRHEEYLDDTGTITATNRDGNILVMMDAKVKGVNEVETFHPRELMPIGFIEE